MRWFPRQLFVRPSRQHLTGMLLLVGVVVALLPIPLSLVSTHTGKDRQEPFPCQDRPCACRTAEQCRKKCCCFTPQQKAAWAKQNGKKAIARGSETKLELASKPTRWGGISSLFSTKARPVKPVVAGPSRLVESESAPRHKLVIGVIAQECQGVDQSIPGQPIFILTPVVALRILIEPRGERLPLNVVLFEELFKEPPVPPPRLVMG